MAWDCATGNGQTAVALARHFRQVIATDISKAQISHAPEIENISYRVETAEKSSLGNKSADLITVSTALHWFDTNKFYREADRVLKNEGILAAWSYFGCSISPGLDEVINFFAYQFLEDYWSPQAKKLWWDRYENLHFPYPLIETPHFSVQNEYTLDEFRMLMLSWSAVQAYIKRHGQNPIEIIESRLSESWGEPSDKKTVTWDLITRIGRKQTA